jgi:hypothetical protein
VRQSLIQPKEELHALALGFEFFFAVAAVYGAVEVLVGLQEGCGHVEGVVEVGEGGTVVDVGLAGVEDALGAFFHLGALVVVMNRVTPG